VNLAAVPDGRLINVVAALAAIVIGLRTILLDVPQVFPGGAKIGAVAYDLSLAYLGAWIFNYLVIVLPRQSDRRLIFRRCDPLIAQYATSARAALAPMFQEANENPEPQQPDAAALHRVCGKINPNDQAPLIVGGSPGSPVYGNWISWLKFQMVRAEARRASLDPYFPYLDAEAVSLITDLADHFFRWQVQTLSEMGSEIMTFFDSKALFSNTGKLARDWKAIASRIFSRAKRSNSGDCKLVHLRLPCYE